MTEPLIDLSDLDLTAQAMTEEELRANIPHAHEWRMIDGICHLDLEQNIIVGYKDWDDDPWWARGHIPGRPLMPGVLMIEGSAQVATILMRAGGWEGAEFIGLGGVDKARFRGMVTPPSRVHFVSKKGSQSNRMARYFSQAFVGGKLIFEMDLLGVKI